MKNRKGFTIVELVIVIAVIAILAAVLIPTFSGVVSKANQSGALQEATSAMKSTLAMSDYGTLTENTQFIIVNNDNKVAYKFKYEGNQIKETTKEEKLPEDYNSIIVRGKETTVNQVKTYVANNQTIADLIGAALGETVYVSQIGAANEDGYYAFTLYKKVDSNGDSKVNSNKTGYEVATDNDGTHKKVENLKIFINVDYPDDIVTVTKSN